MANLTNRLLYFLGMANPKRRVVITLHHPRIFWRKVLTVTLALFALQPMLYFKLYIPATLFLAIILAIHLLFLYVYIAQVPWRELLSKKRIFIGRVLGILIVGYALGLIKNAPSLWVMFVNIIAMTFLHALILALIMIKHVGLTTR